MTKLGWFGMASNLPRYVQRRSKIAQRRSTIGPRWPQDGPEMTPRWPPPKIPEMTQASPKMAPRWLRNSASYATRTHCVVVARDCPDCQGNAADCPDCPDNQGNRALLLAIRPPPCACSVGRALRAVSYAKIQCLRNRMCWLV
jgi:hypothetical protein